MSSPVPCADGGVPHSIFSFFPHIPLSYLTRNYLLLEHLSPTSWQTTCFIQTLPENVSLLTKAEGGKEVVKNQSWTEDMKSFLNSTNIHPSFLHWYLVSL